MYGFAALRVGWPGRFRVRQPLSSQDRASSPQRQLSPDERRQPKRSVIKVTAQQPGPTVCASLMCRCSAATPPQGDVLRHMSDVFGQVSPDWRARERPLPSRNVAPGLRDFLASLRAAHKGIFCGVIESCHAACASADIPEVPPETTHSARATDCSVIYLPDNTATGSDDAVLTLSALNNPESTRQPAVERAPVEWPEV